VTTYGYDLRVSLRLGTPVLTLLALGAFAANSLLTRMALAPGLVDAASFTLMRLTAGALVLCLLVRLQSGGWASLRGGGWVGPVALFAYAAPFTFAYLRIGAAVGALLLFGSVQITMIGWGIIRGERPGLRVWLGLGLAVIGLGILLLPSASRPDLIGSLLMASAGIAWGIYSLRGKTAARPIDSNARNFLFAAPLALALLLTQRAHLAVTPRGLLLAAVSGAVTSGLGYAAWYRALPHLPATAAAILQLSVPVLAALGAVALLNEQPTLRLLGASVVVLLGVALAILRKPIGSPTRPVPSVQNRMRAP
jgi:drug/metabolite transporter (DMT)-like permease